MNARSTRLTELTLAILAPAFLAGCNMVVTEKPMFTLGESGRPPEIRAGVWRNEKADCVFDETLPQDRWPSCADTSPTVGDPPGWIEVAGDPDLLQAPLPIPTPAGKKTYYLYIAFRPLRLDARGRVVEMKSWPVQCGPPPPPDALAKSGIFSSPEATREALSPQPSAENQGLFSPTDPTSLQPMDPDAAATAPQPPTPDSVMADESWHALKNSLSRIAVTRSPLPGMTLNEMGDCTPASTAVLRSAARASEVWADRNARSHWVRDRGPGDKPPYSPNDLTSFNLSQ